MIWNDGLEVWLSARPSKCHHLERLSGWPRQCPTTHISHWNPIGATKKESPKEKTCSWSYCFSYSLYLNAACIVSSHHFHSRQPIVFHKSNLWYLLYGCYGNCSLHPTSWGYPGPVIIRPWHTLPTRAGRSALKTNDFEAQFTISAKPGISGFRGDGFAFWYSEESTGYRERMRGWGLGFCGRD